MMIIVWWLYDDLIIREATIIAGSEVPHDTLADYSCEQGLVKPFMYDYDDDFDDDDESFMCCIIIVIILIVTIIIIIDHHYRHRHHT